MTTTSHIPGFTQAQRTHDRQAPAYTPAYATDFDAGATVRTAARRLLAGKIRGKGVPSDEAACELYLKQQRTNAIGNYCGDGEHDSELDAVANGLSVERLIGWARELAGN